jgi:hypothetical protein
MRSVYTVFRKGAAGEQPSFGFAPIKGVNYSTDGFHTIGVGGDGVNGEIGQAGVTIIGTAQPTQTPNPPKTVSSNGHTNDGNRRSGIKVGASLGFLMWAVLFVAGCVSW